jgi:hypothetical protein
MLTPRALVVAHLPLRQEHGERLSGLIAGHVQLGVQPDYRAADTAGNSPFF